MEFEILLYYQYVQIDDPESFAAKQKSLCQDNNILGRIIISHEGINGTVSGDKKATEIYRRQTLSDIGNDSMQF